MSTPYRFCLQCGKLLAPDQVQCDACGARLKPVAQDANRPVLQPWIGYGPQSSPGAGPSSAGFDPYAPPPPPTPTPQFPLIPQPLPTPQAPQPPPKRSAPGIIIVAAVIVAVLLLGSGIFVFISAINNAGRVSGTPTPAVTPTPTPQLLFSDNFADNHNNWDIASDKESSITLINNTLHMKETGSSIVLSSRFPQSPPADAMINVSFTIINGDENDGIGIRLRSSPHPDPAKADYGYYVEITGDGKSCVVLKWYPDSADNTKGKATTLWQSTLTSLKPNGQQNQVTVIAKGPKIALLVNNEFVQTITDTAGPSLTSGSTYLLADHGKTSKAVEVNYHSVAVYPAPATLPTQ